MQWDVIHFNSGLHDLKQSSPQSPYAVPFDKWRKGGNVHYRAGQQPILGKAVADAVTKALEGGTGRDKRSPEKTISPWQISTRTCASPIFKWPGRRPWKQ
ncbi:MAG: hypothetical protein ACI9UA_005586 [Pseudoalteromonas tetraodonis]|jgi:hypothetical protein